MDKKITVIKKPDVTELAGEKVMVDFETGKYLMLKGVANDIWDLVEDDATISSICDKLLAEYDVTKEVCEAEVTKFLEQLVGYNFIKLADC